MDTSLQTLHRQIPGTGRVEDTLAYIRNPYTFIQEHCRELGSDIFAGRLLMEKTLFISGEEASELFYDTSKFSRKNAMPAIIKNVLLGESGVQGLDGEQHLHRKQMFMDIMTRQSISHLASVFEDELDKRAARWDGEASVCVFNEMCSALTLGVCKWAGVELEESSRSQVTHDLTAMFNEVGTIGLGHLEARRARRRGNRWAAATIQQIRNSGREASEKSEWSPAEVIAFHRDLQGNRLEEDVAAVELLNILRPTVAISVFITLGAHALHRFPDARPSSAMDDDELRCLVQEIRRFYPFFPLVAARTSTSFDWKGWHFSDKQLVLLDLYGTNHDPRIWHEPDRFDPSRFVERKGNSHDFIPQGGGQFSENHRCAGEWITIRLMQVAMRFLMEKLSYEVPEQDLSIDMSKLPALPASGFVIADVKTDPRPV